jgi:GNAT superfamily N-acetyltransferase
MAQSLTIHQLDWSSDRMRDDLIVLYGVYIAESLDHGSFGYGYAAHPTPRFATAVLYDGDRMIGFMCVDREVPDGGPHAIEVIFVEPRYRRKGLATMLVRDGQKHIPDLRLKGPLSADGQALADRTGAGVSGVTPDDVAEFTAQAKTDMQNGITYCRTRKGHRPGNPQLPCSRCRVSLSVKASRMYLTEAFEVRRAFEKWRAS